MKIAFFTGHIAGEPRKASITLLADSFAALGWDTNIVTIGYSWLSILRGDPRQAYAKTLRPDHWFRLSPHLKGYLARPLLNPSRLPSRLLNLLFMPFFKWYSGRLPSRVAHELRDADIISIESGPGLLMVPAIRRLAPQAQLAYMVCDRLATLRVNPVMMAAEKKYATAFDLIAAPSAMITKDYKHPNCHYIPQGVDTAVIDSAKVNPYTTRNNIVSVGDMLFHEQAVTTLARENPGWNIHLFGQKAKCSENLPNIITHGEKPFAEVLPYVKFADIGLAPYRPAPNAEYISQSSLKLKQYTYARLPILAPGFAAANYANIMAYDPNDLTTMKAAFARAVTLDRTRISTEGIKSWAEIAQLYIALFQNSVKNPFVRKIA